MCHCCYTTAWKVKNSKVSFHNKLLSSLTSHMFAQSAAVPKFNLELILGCFQKKPHKKHSRKKNHQGLYNLHLKVQLTWTSTEVITETWDRKDARPSVLEILGIFWEWLKNEPGPKAMAACMMNLHSSATLHNTRRMTKLNLLPSFLLNQRG